MGRLENYHNFIGTVLEYSSDFGIVGKQQCDFFIDRLIDEGHIFIISEQLKRLLINTNNFISKRKIPFNLNFLETYIEDNIYLSKGISFGHNTSKLGSIGLISVLVDVKNGTSIIHCTFPLFTTNIKEYLVLKGNEEKHTPDEEWVNDVKKVEPYLKKIQLFVINFLDFLNNPEVELVTVERTKEENEKRILKGKKPIPPQSFVRVIGKLKIYLDQLNSDTNFSYSHRFDVRGHFRTLRSDKWRNTRGTKIWIPPYIKGKGMYIKKIYDVQK